MIEMCASFRRLAGLSRLAAAVLPFAALLANPSPGLAAGFGPSLGSASGFAALAGSAVTCTHSTVRGDVGVVTGSFTNTGCTILGTIENANAAAAAAYADFLAAYDTLHFNTPCDQ